MVTIVYPQLYLLVDMRSTRHEHINHRWLARARQYLTPYGDPWNKVGLLHAAHCIVHPARSIWRQNRVTFHSRSHMQGDIHTLKLSWPPLIFFFPLHESCFFPEKEIPSIHLPIHIAMLILYRVSSLLCDIKDPGAMMAWWLDGFQTRY